MKDLLLKTNYKKKQEIPFKLSATLIVTDDCDLRCKYCYEENKVHHTMTFDVAKKAVDFILKYYPNFPGISWEFIGGEPLLEIDLIDQITNYIYEAQKDHEYAANYVLGMSTNGTHLGNDKVRRYLLKDKCHKTIGLSLDGCKEVHDLNRCNSFDRVMQNYDWWRKHFPWSTIKATLNRESLPYIEKSIRFLVDDLNLEYVYINTVFEDIWEKEDPDIYYDQLIKVADFLLENERYERHFVSLFDEFITMNFENNHGWCGTGNSMVAIDWQGNVYPCLRFHTLNIQKPLIIGDIWNGLDQNKLKPFQYCHNLRNDACTDCKLKVGCGHCKALDYDVSGSLFVRAKFSCKMHESRFKANEYFFNKIEQLEGVRN